MKLPVMQCDDNCGKCCGIVPVTEKEFTRISAYVTRHHIQPIRQGGECPLYIGGKCSVHEVRPALCRAYGHTSLMQCPKGYNVNVPERKIRRFILRGGPAPRFTHEVLSGGRDLALSSLEELLR